MTLLSQARAARRHPDRPDASHQHQEPRPAVLDAVQVLAAQPRSRWTAGVEHIAATAGIPATLVRSALASMVSAWNADVRKAAQQALTKPTPQPGSPGSTPATGGRRPAAPTPVWEHVNPVRPRRPEAERNPAARPRPTSVSTGEPAIIGTPPKETA